MIRRLAFFLFADSHREPKKNGALAFGGRLFGLLFTTPFLIGGCVILGMTLRDFGTWISARSWVETPGRIVAIEFDRDSEGDATVDLRYSYRFEGNTFESDRWAASTVGGVGNDRGVEFARGTDVEEPVTVWVNPDDPEQALLTQKLYVGSLIGIPFSVPFILVGVCGWGWLLFGGKVNKYKQIVPEEMAQQARSCGLGALAEVIEGPESEWSSDLTKRLQKLVAPRSAGLLRGLGSLAIAVFWNGIVSVFVFLMIGMFVSGRWLIGLGLLVFLSPFIFVGSVLIRAVGESWQIRRAPHWLFAFRKLPNEPQAAEIEVMWMRIDQSDGVGSEGSSGLDQPFHLRLLRGDVGGNVFIKAKTSKKSHGSAESAEHVIWPQKKTGSARIRLPEIQTPSDASPKNRKRREKASKKPGAISMELRWQDRGKERVGLWDLMPDEPSDD